MRVTIAALLAAAFVISACGSANETSREAEGSDDALEVTTVGGSVKSYVRLENQVNDWWGGEGIPITWRASEVDSDDWDGASRPDNPPPQGLQGLVQPSSSGETQTRLERNSKNSSKRFVLTPVASIDGQDISLAPIEFWRGGADYGWELTAEGQFCSDPYRGDETTVPLSVKTPRGSFQYDLVLECRADVDGGSKILVRNYQKS